MLPSMLAVRSLLPLTLYMGSTTRIGPQCRTSGFPTHSSLVSISCVPHMGELFVGVGTIVVFQPAVTWWVVFRGCGERLDALPSGPVRNHARVQEAALLVHSRFACDPWACVRKMHVLEA